MPTSADLVGQRRIALHLGADQEEGRARAGAIEGVEHSRRCIRIGTVVKGDHGVVAWRDSLEAGTVSPPTLAARVPGIEPLSGGLRNEGSQALGLQGLLTLRCCLKGPSLNGLDRWKLTVCRGYRTMFLSPRAPSRYWPNGRYF